VHHPEQMSQNDFVSAAQSALALKMVTESVERLWLDDVGCMASSIEPFVKASEHPQVLARALHCVAFLPQVLGVLLDPWGKGSLGKGSEGPDLCPVVEKVFNVHPPSVTHIPYYAELFVT